MSLDLQLSPAQKLTVLDFEVDAMFKPWQFPSTRLGRMCSQPDNTLMKQCSLLPPSLSQPSSTSRRLKKDCAVLSRSQLKEAVRQQQSQLTKSDQPPGQPKDRGMVGMCWQVAMRRRRMPNRAPGQYTCNGQCWRTKIQRFESRLVTAAKRSVQ